jgi:hypothetical protein
MLKKMEKHESWEHLAYNIHVEDYDKYKDLIQEDPDEIITTSSDDIAAKLDANGLAEFQDIMRELVYLEATYQEFLRDKTLNAPQMMFISVYPMKLRNVRASRNLGLFNYRTEKDSTRKFLLSTAKFATYYDKLVEESRKVCYYGLHVGNTVEAEGKHCTKEFNMLDYLPVLEKECSEDRRCINIVSKIPKDKARVKFFTIAAYMKDSGAIETNKVLQTSPYKELATFASRFFKVQEMVCKREQACSFRMSRFHRSPLISKNQEYADKITKNSGEIYLPEVVFAELAPQRSLFHLISFEKLAMIAALSDFKVAAGKQANTEQAMLGANANSATTLAESEMSLEDVTNNIMQYLSASESMIKPLAEQESQKFVGVLKKAFSKLGDMATKSPEQFKKHVAESYKSIKNDPFSMALLDYVLSKLNKEVDSQRSVFYRTWYWFKSQASWLFSKSAEEKQKQFVKDYAAFFMEMAYEGKAVLKGHRNELLKQVAEGSIKNLEPHYKKAIKDSIYFSDKEGLHLVAEVLQKLRH